MCFFQQINLAKGKFSLVKPKRKVHTGVMKFILNAESLTIAAKIRRSLKGFQFFQLLIIQVLEIYYILHITLGLRN